MFIWLMKQLNETSRVSRVIYLFLILWLWEGEKKQKNNLGTRLKLGVIIPPKLGLLIWLEKVVNTSRFGYSAEKDRDYSVWH